MFLSLTIAKKFRIADKEEIELLTTNVQKN